MVGSNRQIPYGMRKRYEEKDEVVKKRARAEGKKQIIDALKELIICKQDSIITREIDA